MLKLLNQQHTPFPSILSSERQEVQLSQT